MNDYAVSYAIVSLVNGTTNWNQAHKAWETQKYMPHGWLWSNSKPPNVKACYLLDNGGVWLWKKELNFSKKLCGMHEPR